MINGILMKKLLVLSLVFACLTGEAANKADSVVMTVAGKQVSLDEFVFMARKNGEVNLSDRKSLENYVELYKNFKLSMQKPPVSTRQKILPMNWKDTALS